MSDQTAQPGLLELPREFSNFANDLVRWSQLKVVRGFTAPKPSDALERDIGAIARAWRTSNPDFAMRTTNKLKQLGQRFKASPQFARFKAVDLASPGSLDTVELAPLDLSPSELITAIGNLAAKPAVTPGEVLTPESTLRTLRLRTKTIRCVEETGGFWGSDEIVWSVNWVTPRGDTSYSWWRREGFDKGETKSIAGVFSFSVPQKFPNSFRFIFNMLEDDESNAQEIVEKIWAELKGMLKAKIDDFAEWAAGEIGWPEVAEIISATLSSVANALVKWLNEWFAPDPMGTSTWSINLGGGGTTWKRTGTNILPVTLTHAGSDGKYLVDLQFELA